MLYTNASFTLKKNPDKLIINKGVGSNLHYRGDKLVSTCPWYPEDFAMIHGKNATKVWGIILIIENIKN